LNDLVLALSLNDQLSRDFLANPASAIENYNRFALRFGERPVELSVEEKEFIFSLEAHSIQEVSELIVNQLVTLLGYDSGSAYSNLSDAMASNYSAA
jgi:hypothetical protein